MRVSVIAVTTILLVSLSLSVSAQDYTNTSSCLDGAGDWSTGGSYTNISAVAQPGGIAVSSSGDLVNYAGFLNTFALRPDLDTDGNGVPNEYDPDNDADGIHDLGEIEGTNFNPNSVTEVNDPDTDADGSSDGQEAIAGTNPNDASANLHIVNIAPVGSDQEVQWEARQGNEYYVRAGDDLSVYPLPNVLDTNTVTTPGTGAWEVATGTYQDNTGSTNYKYYAIEAVP